ncbi:MAG: P-loop NTPase fold protein [Gallionella sp.]
MSTPKPHNDLPTLADKLAWKEELARLSQRIQDCHTPHVLGIHGDWGSGKTSFMRQLQWQLGGEIPQDGSVADCSKDTNKALQQKIITIWFDAWRYQNEAVPVVALLHEMRRQMATMSVLKEKFGATMEIALRYTLNSLADIGKSIGIEGLPSADKIEKLGNDREAKHHAQTSISDSLRSHLQATIQALLPSEDARVVVFIDDLDRCNPKASIRLLEGLKIYLSIPNCVFVLGMNERILVDAIREEISAPKEIAPEELKLRAAHYLEKICTDIYRLPLPKDAGVLLGQWIADSEQCQALTAALGKIVCLPPNPRRLKALANQWDRFAACVAFPASQSDQEIWAVRVLIAAYIHQFHRDLWERWYFTPDFILEVKTWCSTTPLRDLDGKLLPPPAWASALKLTQKEVNGTWQTNFPNPGDIDIFWVDGLIRHYRDSFVPDDFMPLLGVKLCAPMPLKQITP